MAPWRRPSTTSSLPTLFVPAGSNTLNSSQTWKIIDQLHSGQDPRATPSLSDKACDHLYGVGLRLDITRTSNPKPATLGHLEAWNRSGGISQSYLTHSFTGVTYNIVSSPRTVSCFKASKDGPIEPY
ncbi:hypothetical protein CF326_g9904 [Tilletia indica]|nr:hypothetical protein CF326_g9904 [Tilletia indica]